MRRSTLYPWTPLIVATILVFMVTPLFWVTDLDIRAAGWFFDASDPAHPWPREDAPLWAFFYEASWIMSLGIMLLSVALIVAARAGKIPRVWSPRGWSLLLVLVLGAGLVVNLGFKDNFGRYRPRQIEPFLGTHQYQMPLEPGIPGTGKSFPSGHPSPAFAMTILYFFWRGRRPLLAWGSLLAALAVGALMGVGRMAAGAHFLSDVIWSGYFMFATAGVVYYALIRVPEQEQRLASGEQLAGFSARQKLLLSGILGLAVFSSLFTRPVGHESVYEVSLAGLDRVELRYDEAEVQVRELESGESMRIEVVSRSFGMPGAEIERRIEEEAGQLHFDLSHSGRFTEKGTRIFVDIPAAERAKLELVDGQP